MYNPTGRKCELIIEEGVIKKIVVCVVRGYNIII